MWSFCVMSTGLCSFHKPILPSTFSISPLPTPLISYPRHKLQLLSSSFLNLRYPCTATTVTLYYFTAQSPTHSFVLTPASACATPVHHTSAAYSILGLTRSSHTILPLSISTCPFTLVHPCHLSNPLFCLLFFCHLL